MLQYKPKTTIVSSIVCELQCFIVTFIYRCFIWFENDRKQYVKFLALFSLMYVVCAAERLAFTTTTFSTAVKCNWWVNLLFFCCVSALKFFFVDTVFNRVRGCVLSIQYKITTLKCRCFFWLFCFKVGINDRENKQTFNF